MAERQRVLIVDDDANIAELISLYLIKECYETQIVYDGEEALKVFPVFRPNIILLDLMLPGIDGYQVCRELRASSRYQSLCCQQRERSLTKYWDWNWVRMTISSSLLIPRNWLPG